MSRIGIDAPVQGRTELRIGSCANAEQNVLRRRFRPCPRPHLVHILVKIGAVRPARFESAFRRSHNPVRRLHKRLELGRHFVQISGEQRIARLRLADRPVITVLRNEAVRNREAKRIDPGRIAVIAACIKRKFDKIPYDVVVRIGRIVNVRTSITVVIYFDVHW
ncbi:hypothetical protein D3C84_922160 [compost metagenome]